jgi:hypothetical protein
LRTAKLIDTKSLLAKLMAAENIVVLHENVPTAYFDIHNRVLHCPIWKDMSSDLYDLVMGHEIGHALNTPERGWHNALLKCKQNHEHEDSCYDPEFKFFLNVCEDARIEKKIKIKFPGLKKSFSEAYQKLNDRDFFGIKKLKDVNQLNLIDRVNVYFKLGSFIPVNFNDEERLIVKELEVAETFEEVEAAARKIYKFVQKDKNKINNLDDLLEAIQDNTKFGEKGEKGKKNSSESEDPCDEFSDSDQACESDEDSGDSESSSDESDQDSKEPKNIVFDAEEGGCSTKKNNSATKPSTSVTDKVFRDHEKELVDTSTNSSIANCTLPTPNLAKIIQTTNTVVSFFEKSASTDMQTVNLDYVSTCDALISHFNSKNKNYINLLVKEFEMRKNA